MNNIREGRVLIVDNLEKWREELIETLQRAGYYADSASSAPEALKSLYETLYHVMVLDIRMDEADQSQSNIDGILLLRELDKQGLSEATKVIMLSAYGTKELMRTSFREYKVVDFLSKDEFNNQEFLEIVRQVFAQKVNINLELEIHWLQGSKPEQFVLNLDVDGARVKKGTLLQSQVVAELEDLLCRLFYQAKSVLVRPLTPGKSGTGVLQVQPFFATGGAGHEVIVKFGDFRKIEEEYHNFKQYVQPFIGGGRNTSVLDLRHTTHLGGITYSLLGTTHDQLVDFGDFYHRADVPQISDALDRLFRDTCGTWYASHGNLQPLNLTEEYQRLFGYTPERLEQVLYDQLKTVQGKHTLHFRNLKGERTFTNPLLATAGLTLVRPTYKCTTHGDFNQYNLLVDSTGHVWLIDFQGTGQSHILRDVAMLDSAIRFQLLASEEATLDERLQMEQALCSIERFSQVEQLEINFSTENPALAKTYAIIVHLRKVARRLVTQNPGDDISEYYIALLYNAMNTLRFASLPSGQREHAVLSACLLADRLGLSS
jgi:CheY-like chemotaxis protein